MINEERGGKVIQERMRQDIGKGGNVGDTENIRDAGFKSKKPAEDNTREQGVTGIKT